MHDRLGEKQENGEHQGGLPGLSGVRLKRFPKKTRHTRAAAVMLPQITRLFQSKGLHTWYRTKRPTKSTVMADMVYS